MKTNPLTWTTAVLALLLTVLWWRQGDLRDEITALRAEMGSISAKAPPVAREPSSADFAPSEATSSIGVPRSEDRLAELEHVVNAQADLVEELMAQLSQISERDRRASARAWGPEQAVGAPDTMTAGDHRTAWAPAFSEAGVEWLEAEFKNPSDLSQVVVRQTSNPGAITKVVAISESGAEIPIWQGVDPSRGQKLADTPFSVPPGVIARKVKVFLDTSIMPGWEEIDAIKIVGRDGSQQWANSVNASSTYAQETISSHDKMLQWIDRSEPESGRGPFRNYFGGGLIRSSN